MKSAKLNPNPNQIVGGCSTEYPKPRPPMGLLEMALNAFGFTAFAWLLFYVLCKWLGVL